MAFANVPSSFQDELHFCNQFFALYLWPTLQARSLHRTAQAYATFANLEGLKIGFVHMPQGLL
eukprot:3702806-Pleurochrysis_carterae.AAC.1